MILSTSVAVSLPCCRSVPTKTKHLLFAWNGQFGPINGPGEEEDDSLFPHLPPLSLPAPDKQGEEQLLNCIEAAAAAKSPCRRRRGQCLSDAELPEFCVLIYLLILLRSTFQRRSLPLPRHAIQLHRFLLNSTRQQSQVTFPYPSLPSPPIHPPLVAAPAPVLSLVFSSLCLREYHELSLKWADAWLG